MSARTPSTNPQTDQELAETTLLHLSQRAQQTGNQPIGELMHRALANPDLISLAAGFVDPFTLPLGPVREAFEQIWQDPKRVRSVLQYGTTAGSPELREHILLRHHDQDGQSTAESGLSVDNLVVTAGSNQLLHLLSELLFNPGDIVLCTAPTYFVYLGLLKNLGVRAIGVEMDEQGMIPEALKETLAQLEAQGELSKVKAIYLVDYFDNPSGVTLSRERRPEIVKLAKTFSQKHPIYILEDAAYRELRYSGENLPSMRSFDESGETVIVCQTFSKSFAPGLRVGCGMLPTHLVEPVINMKGNLDFGSPHFAQELIAEVFRQDIYDCHIRRLQREYRVKLRAMLSALDTHFSPFPEVTWLKPDGGLYVWLSLPNDLDTSPAGTLFDLALQEGILYVPGHFCFPPEGTEIPKNTIRLSFGVQTPERIEAGIKALAQAFQQVKKSK
ncbi:Transcriptional regulator with HTH domain and aminotransferase domain [Planctomycetales bacterium 10988]|nr:Transcriptional regulator with HTH domain and aminotransferase domain [Planctomycetales bacterium 10988]